MCNVLDKVEQRGRKIGENVLAERLPPAAFPHTDIYMYRYLSTFNVLIS